MNDSSKSDFLKVLTIVMHTCGGEVNDLILYSFWEVLKEYDWMVVQKAFYDFLGDTEHGFYVPKPANIKRLIIGCVEEKSLIALSKLDKAIRECGPYNSVVFDDTYIAHVIEDMGGWIKFGTINDKEYVFIRTEFQKRYREYVRQGKACSPKVLLGKEANSKREHGEPLPEPKFIGNIDKCNEIYAQVIESSKYLGNKVSDLISKNVITIMQQHKG